MLESSHPGENYYKGQRLICPCQRRHSLPPFGHDGTDRRIARLQDPTEQTRCNRGKKKYHAGKNVLLINMALAILLLRETYAGSTHEKRMAEATPYPLPAGNRSLQDLGFLAFTLDQVEIIMPTRKPRGRALTRAQQAANQRIARRRVRIEHVTAASNAVASCTTPAASAGWVSAIRPWKFAARCITFAYV